MASFRTIDDLDASILQLLQENARTTQADIAKAVGLASSAVLERIRKLEAKGAIREYVASIDPHVVERALLAFVSVRTSEYGPEQPAAHALARRRAPGPAAAAGNCCRAARDIHANDGRSRHRERDR
jgi:DNA-binding Lrp family transcriptional regulator